MAPGEDVAIIPGTSDYGPGTNRVSFLVVDKQSQLIERPTARVWIARGLKQKPYRRDDGDARADRRSRRRQGRRAEHLRDDGRHADAGEVLDPRRAGRREEDPGAREPRRRASGRPRPTVGERAIPSRNPTLRPGVDPKSSGRDDGRAARPGPPPHDRRGGDGGEAAVRRHVRDAALLSDAHVRPGRPGRPVGREGTGRARASTSSTSRSTRTTTRPRGRTGGSTSGTSRASRSRSSSTARA